MLVLARGQETLVLILCFGGGVIFFGLSSESAVGTKPNEDVYY